jgi:hypothetical protein
MDADVSSPKRETASDFHHVPKSIDVLIDTTQFPLVWMQIAASSNKAGDSSFAEFEALLARKEVFVLLNEEDLVEGEHEHWSEEMEQTSLWMKSHKDELRAFVKASIHIEASTAKRLPSKALAVAYEKFWGYPMLMTATKEEALTLARKLLASESVKSQGL